MLKTSGTHIVDEHGEKITLKGINIGGWLMMEGYMLGGRNIPEHMFKKELARLHGKNAPLEFTKLFRDSYFSREDIKRIKKLGFNCVRLPFNYRLLEEKNGLSYLKKTVRLFAQQGLYVILDMHAAPGSQNIDWHSDSDGRALFWQKVGCRNQYIKLWEKLSSAFKSEKMVAGYDVMNEPVTDNISLLTKTFQTVISAIRGQGDRHIIFVEGNNWGMDTDYIESLKDDNLAVSIHYYRPVEYTFNWLPGLKYPGRVLGKLWNKKEMEKLIKDSVRFAKKLKKPLFCGEFGVASRCDLCGAEYRWVDDVLSLFKKYGIHWTYWTYKSVKGVPLPDGVFQLTDASGIIGNAATKTGMDNFYGIYGSRKKDLFRLLLTDNFVLNKKLFAVAKQYL